MSSNKTSTGGVRTRCTYPVILLITLLALSFSSSTFAQDHGASIGKVCDSPVRTCDSNADCDDSNECTQDICPLGVPDTLVCRYTVSYDDDFLDDTSIVGAFDTIFAAGGNVRVPGAGNARISAVSGNTTCVVGAFVECIIGPNLGGGIGQVTFISDEYQPVPADPSPIQDQGTIQVKDVCNGLPAGTGSCFPTVVNNLQFGSAANLVGCSNPPEPSSTTCTDTGGTECWEAGCDGQGVCVQEHVGTPPSTPCADTGEECADAGCDGSGVCDQLHAPLPPSTTCADTGGTECWEAGCDGSGVCVQEHVGTPPSTPCADTGEECADAGCDGSGVCDQLHAPLPPSTTCADTGEECADAGCDGSGVCDQLHAPLPPSTPCADTGDDCFDAGCDGSGVCNQEHVDNICVVSDICRTPGFWKMHAGTEKNNSRNVTQETIDWAGGSLDVCGTTITNTDAGNYHSAEEAMCISVRSESRLQLIRQLTAAALNCVVSGGSGDCTGVASIEALYGFCNDACEFEDSAEYGDCIEAIDDWNNGRTGNLCHDQSLCPDFDDDGLINGTAICLEPHGPAGSNDECKAALNSPVLLP